MSWIKDNQFIATLGGVTLVLVTGLVIAGLQGSSRYSAASQSYQEFTTKVSDSESLPLYPTQETRDGKKKALGAYREAVTGLQNEFGKFRPEPFQNIASQDFTNRLKTANSEVITAFQAAKTVIPDALFLGFETYTNSLARENATGLLDYQLGAAKELLLALAKSNPSQLYNVYRPRLPEEDGTVFTPAPTAVSRALPFEISFKGPETSLRAFLSAISQSSNYYYVVRSVRISNEKKTAPLASDGKFEPVAPPTSATQGPSDGGFVLALDNETPPAAAPGAAATTPEPAPEPVPAAATPDAGRILSQVLGSEELNVFLRIDVMQFLPAKPLPQP